MHIVLPNQWGHPYPSSSSKSLSLANIIHYANEKWDYLKFLPDYKNRKLPNRDLLCNIVNTLIPDQFEDFIKVRLKYREQRLVEKRNLQLNILPNLFSSSKTLRMCHVSLLINFILCRWKWEITLRYSEENTNENWGETGWVQWGGKGLEVRKVKV